MTTLDTATGTERDSPEDPHFDPEDTVMADRGTLWGSLGGAVSSNLGIVLMPLGIIALAVVLAIYVSGYDKDFTETDALAWDSLRPQFQRHVWLTAWSTLLVLFIAIPLGIGLTRPSMRWLAGPILAVANSGQSVPAYGLLVVFGGWLGADPSTVVYALVVFATLPVLRNTMVGLDQVDRATIEAGRGMGMSKGLVLWKIELPLAVPVILAGVRTALIINVGTAALAFLIGGGGLGETINTGLKLGRDLVTFTGAAIVALVALTVDWLASVAEKFLRPRGI
jgi:osmoprotectant transport system permease protein